MKTIPLSSQGLMFSEQGFGCMGLTTAYGKKLPDADIVSLLKSVYENVHLLGHRQSLPILRCLADTSSPLPGGLSGRDYIHRLQGGHASCMPWVGKTLSLLPKPALTLKSFQRLTLNLTEIRTSSVVNVKNLSYRLYRFILSASN